jgi:hypothetical protein
MVASLVVRGTTATTVRAARRHPAGVLTIEEVVDVVRYLLHTGDNVKTRPADPVAHHAQPRGGLARGDCHD